jgi:hypothetical protein
MPKLKLKLSVIIIELRKTIIVLRDDITMWQVACSSMDDQKRRTKKKRRRRSRRKKEEEEKGEEAS